MTSKQINQSLIPGKRIDVLLYWAYRMLLIPFFFVVLLYKPAHAVGLPGQFVDTDQLLLESKTVALGDLDNDGDLDAFAVNAAFNSVWLNQTGIQQGNPGSFRNAQTLKPPGDEPGLIATSVALGDIDGDGDLDAMVGVYGKGLQLWINQGGVQGEILGTFKFDERQELNDSTVNAIALGDIDGDGDFDAIVGDDTSDKILENQGGKQGREFGIFIVKDFPNLGAFTTTLDVALGDIDNDGDLDIFLANYSGLTLSKNEVWLNRGIANQKDLGVFELDLRQPFVNASNLSVVLGDVDNDTDLDAIVTYHVNTEGKDFIQVWLNQTCHALFKTCNDETQRGIFKPDQLIETLLVNRVSALGDIDNDGDLDAFLVSSPDAVASVGANVLVNQGGVQFSGIGKFAVDQTQDTGLNVTSAAALGDLDNDGDLDAYVSTEGGDKIWFYNSDNAPFNLRGYSSGSSQTRTDVALGDLNCDGYLDAFITTASTGNELWINQRSAPGDETPRTFVLDTTQLLGNSASNSVALGDLDNDNDIDAVVANVGPDEVWINQGTLQNKLDCGKFAKDMIDQPITNPNNESGSTGIALGDFDQDGDLDAFIVNYGVNEVWRNINDKFELDTRQNFGGSSTNKVYSNKVALGDLDNDGDLDAFVVNQLFPNNPPSSVWINQGIASGIFQKKEQTFGAIYGTSIALGDLDGDGDLDAFVTNGGENIFFNSPNQILLNQGGIQGGIPGTFIDSRQIIEYSAFKAATLGDVDGDGDLDVVMTSLNQGADEVWINQGSAQVGRAGIFKKLRNPLGLLSSGNALVSGDLDGDGDIDIFKIDDFLSYVSVYFNQTRNTGQLFIALAQPGPTLKANHYSSPVILSSPIISTAFSLLQPTNQPAGRVVGYFSLNGGDNWKKAEGSSGLNDVPEIPGAQGVFAWNVFDSKVFGQSDNVVIRLDAYEQPTPVNQKGYYLYANRVSGPYQWPYATSKTLPFRVRGTQIYVENEQKQPVENAIVYLLSHDPNVGSTLITDGAAPRYTSSKGYLSGSGNIAKGDQLLALKPIRNTEKYTLYETNGSPSIDGIDAYTVTTSGVQTLTVSSEHPLLIFPITVTLEWDASKDIPFQRQLEEDLSRASRSLYDWTNGQVALGKVTVYQAKAHWTDADIQIFASNQVRPNAARGGIITQTLTLPFEKPNEPRQVIGPGKVHIGPTWNRYGDPGAIGEDWPHTLAHELGHYLLYLEDTYLGVNPQTKVLEAVTTCTGTAMTDPYLDVDSEFRTRDANWDAQCGQSLAELPDWEIITNRYPALHSPTTVLAGPVSMPFAFTEVTIQPNSTDTTTLIDDPIVQIDGDGLSSGRAYLIRDGIKIVDLGRPVGTSVLARGAQIGDEVCVFGQDFFDCETFQNNSPLRLTGHPAWPVEITITPVDTTTVQIVTSENATATFYPEGNFSQTVLLEANLPQTIAFNQLMQNVLLDLVGADPLTQHTTISYAIDDGPGRKWSHNVFSSGDGGAVIYPPKELEPAGFLILQTVTRLPAFPQDLKVIGRAYNVHIHDNATTFHEGSISFQYLGSDVLLSGHPESELAIHYWDGSSWTRLETTINGAQNIASAVLPGPGIYILTVGVVQLGFKQSIPGAAEAGQAYTLMLSSDSPKTYFMNPLLITLTSEAGQSRTLTATLVNSQTLALQTPLDLPPDLYAFTLIHPGSVPVTMTGAFALYTTKPTATTCFFDDFNSGLGKWSKEKPNDWGIVTRDGWEAVTDSPNQPYRSAESGQILTTTLTSQPFDLAACSHTNNDPDATPMLSLRHGYQLLANDSIAVALSTDDGLTWHTLLSYGGQNLAEAAELPDNEWSGVKWITTTLNLAAYKDTTSVRLRFTLVANDFGSAKGWIIDEVNVSPDIPTSSPSGDEPTLKNKLFLPFVSQRISNDISLEGSSFAGSSSPTSESQQDKALLNNKTYLPLIVQ